MTLIELSKPELKLFLTWLHHPVNVLTTIKYLWKLYCYRANPKNPLGLTKTYTCILEDRPTFRYCSYIRSDSRAEVVKGHVALPLAGTEYIVNNSIDWDSFFADREDYSALHRFCWLNNKPQFFISGELGYQFIKNWIDTFHHNEDDCAYQSYNISERLVSWMLFLTRWKNQSVFKGKLEIKIFNSIKKQLYILANNLEQSGEYYTNNHLLNNGRALYMAGWFINDLSMVDVGRQCIRFGYKNLISAKGFLKEHSSHYHLLISKNFLEIYLIASEFDSDFRKELQPTLKKLFTVASLFIGQKSDSPIPLIGDISPDAPPLSLSTFYALLNKRAEDATEKDSDIDWFDIWDVSNVNLFFLKLSTSTITTFNDPESGFFYCLKGAFRFYFHNPISNSKPNFSHYHADDLSFTLMLGDRPVIHDPGRSTYIQSHTLSQYAKSSYAHNTVFFNQMPISPHKFKLFPQCYAQPDVTVEEIEQKESLKLLVTHNGFRRIQKNIYFQREFQILKTSFRLNDFWKLPIQGIVMTRFHLGHEIAKIIRGDNCLFLIFQNHEEEIKLSYKIDKLVEIKTYKGILGTEAKKCGGWAFPRYGVSLPAFSLDFIQEVSGSFVNKFELTTGEAS